MHMPGADRACDAVAAPDRAQKKKQTKPLALVPGLLLAAALATVATILAPFAPILGAPVLAILFGVALRSFFVMPRRFEPGIAYSARTVLQGAIIVSGFGISLINVYRTGLGTLPVTLGTIAVALLLAPIVGRILGLDLKLRELVAVGTAICGASAIAAVSAVIEPTEAEVALAIATIFLYNIIAVLTFPLLGHVLGLSQAQFGVWAGSAINDTSSVVAAGFAFGHEAGVHATIVKLTRATLILPIVGVMALARARAVRSAGQRIPWRKIVPWFILWFLAAALVNTAGIIPAAWHGAIAAVSTFLISLALAAIGLQTAVARLFRAGARPLALGFVLWSAVAISSLAIQHFTGL
jgi:uncharacterized integral membrane protein (TIGR00698 family)